MLLDEVHLSHISLFLLAGLVFVGLGGFLRFVGLLGGLGADALEDGKAALGWHGNVELADIGVGNLIDSRLHNGGVLVQQVLVACSLRVEVVEVAGGVGELAAHSILAEALAGHVALAERHAELAGDVRLLHEFVLAVGERALCSKFAVLAIQPELANFSLLLLLVGGLKNVHVFLGAVFLLANVVRMGAWHVEGGGGGGLENLG